MTTVIVEDVELEIPSWVKDQESFRRWAHDPAFPEHGNIWWLRGGVWADMSMEQLFSHLAVKTAFYQTLSLLVDAEDTGRFVPDGLLLSNLDAGLSGEPDGTFFTHEAWEDGRVCLIEGAAHGYTEVVGSPEMVLEIVSDGSIKKDFDFLPEDYFRAGIEEYWRVDARTSPPVFEILRRNAKGFVSVRKVSGWLKSAVFGKSFRLTETKDKVGHPKFRLEVK